MSIKYTETDLPGVLLINPRVFEDSRGFFMETFHQKKYADAGIDHSFIQDNYSHSTTGDTERSALSTKPPSGQIGLCYYW